MSMVRTERPRPITTAGFISTVAKTWLMPMAKLSITIGSPKGANESLLSHLAGRLLLLCDGKRFCENGSLVLFHDEGKELGLSVL